MVWCDYQSWLALASLGALWDVCGVWLGCMSLGRVWLGCTSLGALWDGLETGNVDPRLGNIFTLDGYHYEIDTLKLSVTLAWEQVLAM